MTIYNENSQSHEYPFMTMKKKNAGF